MMLPLNTVSFVLSALASLASASSVIPVTGVLAGPNTQGEQVPLRRSITDLFAEAGPQWDLYIQALGSMYGKDSSDPESFFQIAGIHGRPFIQWNDAGPMLSTGWGGYSTHGENLFIIWHRPFVALFEQTLVKEAKKLAAGYPDEHRAIYEKAAEHLRAPFWDWAVEPRLPEAVLPDTIQVNVATEAGITQRSIDNPLYTFKFPQEVMNGKYGSFNTYDRMYRCANSASANENLASRNYKTRVYDAFTRSRSFENFATTASSGGSIEAIHNAVHWDAGCGGQFLDSQYSSFEPLFMLHHSNVDRLWAYWQAIHPESSTFEGSYYCLARFATPGGTMIDLESPLQPFKQADGSWHTSSSVNSIKSLGYSYEGLDYGAKSEADIKKSAIEMINSLYGPSPPERHSTSSAAPKPTKAESSLPSTENLTTSSSPSSSTSSSTSTSTATSAETSAAASSTPAKSRTTIEASKSQVKAQSTAAASRMANRPAEPETTMKATNGTQENPTDSETRKQFYAGITVDVSELPVRPCSIEISIDEWRAGSMVIMKMPETGIIHDTISLSDAIKSVHLTGLSDGELLKVITSRFHVKVIKPDGSTVNVSKVQGLKVHIEEVNVISAPHQSEMPQISEPTTHEVLDKSVQGCPAPAK